MMTRIQRGLKSALVFIALLALVAPVCRAETKPTAAGKPNVLVILVDDNEY